MTKILPPSSIRHAAGACALALAVLAAPLAGQDADLRKAVKGMRADRERDKGDKFAAGVRELTWRLLVGDKAGDPALHLPSETRAYLEDGLARLDKFQAELKADKGLEGKLAANAALMLRLDQILLRRAQLAKKKDLARQEERDRLNQLRDLASTYRELTAQLAAMNTYFLLGDDATVRKLNDDVTARLKKLEEIASRRVDYYLFKDEPKLDADEVKLLTSVTGPVVNDLVTHFKSLQGLMAYRLAIGRRRDVGERKKGLEEADRIVAGLVKDPAKPSLIAQYVHGLSQEELGLLATADKPLDAGAHKLAAPHFKEARAAFDRAAGRVKDEPAAGGRIDRELKRRQAELASPAPFTAEAEKRTREGKPDEAAAVLKRGLQIHRDGKLAAALAEAQLRAGQDPAATRELLAQAVKGGVLPDADRAGLLVRGWAELAQVRERLARGPDKVSAADRRLLLSRLRDARELFAQAARGPADAAVTEPVAAYTALDYAYAGYLDPAADAAGAMESFGKLKGAVEALKRRADAGDLAAREALVAARLAQGFLAIRFQPAYREDALLAFAAAADEQARLPFGRSSVKLFGSPVLAALLSRPEMQGLRVAAEERQLRELASRVAEGLAALRLGAADAAARQMKSSLEQVEALSGEPPVDAGRLLDRKEEDARATLRTHARALAVLTLIAGGQPEVAVREAFKLSPAGVTVRKPDDLDPADVRVAAAAITDPLAAYALGLAVEEYATTKVPPGSARARALLAEAAAVQRRTQELLKKSPALRERYPQVELLTAQALERLTAPESYVAAARRLRKESQVPDAVRVVEEGLRRHPDEEALQEERILARLDEADLAPARPAAAVQKTVADAERASKDGVLKDARGLIALGEAHERLGQDAEALAAYRRALKARPSREDEIRARSRIAVLSARLAAVRAP
jgi:hypothetical protein